MKYEILDTQNHHTTQTVRPVETRINLELLTYMKPYNLQNKTALEGTM
jgi:hypothetical protein